MDATDSLGGCRSGKNAIKSGDYRTSGGVISIMALDGTMCSLTEVLHTESQTEVILRIFETFTNSTIHHDYYCRQVVAFGYDMMCNILSRLSSPVMDQLMRNDELVKQVLYWWDTLGLHRLFIDKLHISSHDHIFCQNDENTGLLHPKLSKFKGILNEIDEKVNEQQVEQLWRFMNRMGSMRLLCTERFGIALFLQREHHNNENKLRLEAAGYRWEPLSNWNLIREMNEESYFAFDGIASADELLSRQTVGDIQRIGFALDEEIEYRNVWVPWDESESMFKVNQEQLELLKGVKAQVQFRKAMAGTVNIAEIKDFVIGWKSIKIWKRFKVLITNFVASLL